MEKFLCSCLTLSVYGGENRGPEWARDLISPDHAAGKQSWDGKPGLSFTWSDTAPSGPAQSGLSGDGVGGGIPCSPRWLHHPSRASCITTPRTLLLAATLAGHGSGDRPPTSTPPPQSPQYSQPGMSFLLCSHGEPLFFLPELAGLPDLF